jgi:hypothetical protein
MMARDLARAFDPNLWFTDADIVPDDWQTAAIRSPSKRQLWLVHRQGGKSTTAALKALAKATQEPDSLSLLISPSQRQSAELLRKVAELAAAVPDLPKPSAEAAHRLEFAHGGRILSLPSSEQTIRGYSNVALLILDEAARIPDEIVAACRPMLAVSNGEIVCLTTPWGQRGFFHEEWVNGGDGWERTLVTVEKCKRISPDFLTEERRTFGEMIFRQEYMCEFVSDDEQMFPVELVAAAFSAEVQPLWQ